MATPRVLSVNIGTIREVEWRGRPVTTGIWKHPVDGRVALRGVNFEGDDQADRTVHGGPDKAVYVYAKEDYEFWHAEGYETPPGLFGENLTIEGIDLSAAVAGEHWTIGSAVLEVAQPRLPCYKLGLRMGDPQFPKKFLAALRMGAYLRIVKEGDIGTGDEISVKNRPDHGVTLRAMTDTLRHPEKIDALRQIEKLPSFWQHVLDGR